MTTDCMHTCSLLTAIRCGGIGDGTGALPDQVGDGDGILLIGTVVTGVAIGEATGAVIGASEDITITPIMDGEEALIKGALIPTTTAVQKIWYGTVRWGLHSTVMAEPEVV